MFWCNSTNRTSATQVGDAFAVVEAFLWKGKCAFGACVFEKWILHSCGWEIIQTQVSWAIWNVDYFVCGVHCGGSCCSSVKQKLYDECKMFRFLSQIEFFSETQAFGGTQRIYLFCLIVPTGYVSKCKKVANNCFVFVISFCVFRILEMLTTGHHRWAWCLMEFSSSHFLWT